MKKTTENFQPLLNYSLKILSIRPRSEHELRTKLLFFCKKHQVRHFSKLIEEVMEKLKQLNFLNDLDFALWFTEQRSNITPKARRFIEMELRGKGVSEENINQAFASSDFPSDQQKAKSLAFKRLTKIKSLPVLLQKKRLLSHLAGKGFSPSIIFEVIDTIFSKK